MEINKLELENARSKLDKAMVRWRQLKAEEEHNRQLKAKMDMNLAIVEWVQEKKGEIAKHH